MQKLEKRAIDAALKSNWEEAAELNLQILEKYPKDISAKNRLGKAYIQMEDWNKAKKVLKEVLESDPINQVAKKNLRIAENHIKIKKDNNSRIEAEDFVKEPGTSLEIDIDISDTKKTIDDFEIGESLDLKLNKESISVYSSTLDKKIGEINIQNLVTTLKSAKKNKIDFKANMVGGKNSLVEVLIKAKKPIFKSHKQDVRPYVKKGILEEPEIEIPENEMTEIE